MNEKYVLTMGQTGGQKGAVPQRRFLLGRDAFPFLVGDQDELFINFVRLSGRLLACSLTCGSP